MTDYKCARAISVDRISEDKVRKTYADYNRKGLTPEQWQQEMKHELALMKKAGQYANTPAVKDVQSFHYDMAYCGEPVKELTMDELITIKHYERDMIHKAELYHNDIKPENVLRDENNQLHIIDYGRATVKEPGEPFFTHVHLFDVDISMYSRIAERADKLIQTTNAHGGKKPYYGFDNKEGVRYWPDRFKALKTITDYSGKRILDLGCNQGLFGIHIAQAFNPLFVMGVDASKDIIKAADLTALCTRQNAYFKHLNIANGDKRNPHLKSHDSWTEELGYNWDIVSALSLYHWVKDKDELLIYLSHFNCVIIECHDDNELAEISNHFLQRNYRMNIVSEGSTKDYDRPLVSFHKDL